MPTAVVPGTSLLQIIFVAANVTLLQAYTNHTVDAVLALLLLLGGVIGAQFGTRFGTRLRGEQLRFLLALLVLAVAAKLAFDLTMPPERACSRSRRHRRMSCAACLLAGRGGLCCCRSAPAAARAGTMRRRSEQPFDRDHERFHRRVGRAVRRDRRSGRHRSRWCAARSARLTVWRKGKIAGIWANAEFVTFNNVPSFYAVAASRPIEELVPPSTARALPDRRRQSEIRRQARRPAPSARRCSPTR